MYLLDTCTLLWLASDHAQLSQAARMAIDAYSEASVSW